MSSGMQTLDDSEVYYDFATSGPEKLYGKILKLAVKFASTEFGQYAIDKMDKALVIIESTAKWSLPQFPEKEKSEPSALLHRPLPWIPFIFTIVLLRFVRIALSIGSLLIGNSPITASNMVYFIQIRRRKLRSIRFQGIRALRARQQNKSRSIGLLAKLSSLLTIVICRPGKSLENTSIRISKSKKISEENEQTNLTSEIQSNKKRRLEDDSEDESLTVEQMLDKYAKNISDDDGDDDYVPDKSKLNKESSSSSSSEDEFENNKEQSNDDSFEFHQNNGDAVPQPISIIKSELQDENEPETIQKDKINKLQDSTTAENGHLKDFSEKNTSCIQEEEDFNNQSKRNEGLELSEKAISPARSYQDLMFAENLENVDPSNKTEGIQSKAHITHQTANYNNGNKKYNNVPSHLNQNKPKGKKNR